MSVVDKPLHEPVEERQQQRPDMLPVHVRVGHNHTGLVVDVIFDDNGNLVQIITAEGNTSSNGGNVTNKAYDVPGGSGRIIGFCSPDYGRV